MKRPDPYELKYGNPDWCHDAQPDGRKAVSSILEDFRANPDQYLTELNFPDETTGHGYCIATAMENGFPFAATLHDHADHTNLHVRWWLYSKEFVVFTSSLPDTLLLGTMSRFLSLPSLS